MAASIALIIAGLAIFPIVFFVGMEPNAGPTLMFQTLPAAFHAMPGGAIVGFLFFVLAGVPSIMQAMRWLP